MASKQHVAVFWDYENCRPPANTSGYAVVDGILGSIQGEGCVMLFKAYMDLTLDVPGSKTTLLHSELQSSGVSLTHCPHNGKKDVADKMMIVDMLIFAMDIPPPATIVLITGDRDFAYVVSLLRLRGYAVIVIVPSAAHSSLKMRASKVLKWQGEVLDYAELTLEKPLTLGGHPSKRLASETTSYPNCEVSRLPSDAITTNCCIPDGPVSMPSVHRRAASEASQRLPRSFVTIREDPSPIPGSTGAYNQNSCTGSRSGASSLDKTSLTSAAHQPNTTTPLEISNVSPVIHAIMDRELGHDGIIPVVRDVQHFEGSNIGKEERSLNDLDKGDTANRFTTRSPSSISSIIISGSSTSVAKIQTSDVHIGTTVSPVVQAQNATFSTAAFTNPSISLSKNDIRFSLLADLLKERAREGITKVRWSQIGSELLKRDPMVYEKVGVSRLGDYIELAVSAGLVTTSSPNVSGERWAELAEDMDVAHPSIRPLQGLGNFHVPSIYLPLLTILEFPQSINGRMLFSECGSLIRDMYPNLYQQAGVQRLSEYISDAEANGIVRTGGIAPRQWVEAVYIDS